MNHKIVPFNVLDGTQKKIAFNMLYNSGFSQMLVSNIDIILDELGLVIGYRILRPVASVLTCNDDPQKRDKPKNEWDDSLDLEQFIKYMQIHAEIYQLIRHRDIMIKRYKTDQQFREKIIKFGAVTMDVAYIIDGRLFLGIFEASYEKYKFRFRLKSVGSSTLISKLSDSSLRYGVHSN